MIGRPVPIQPKQEQVHRHIDCRVPIKPKPFLDARLRLPVQDFIHGLIPAPWPHAGEAEIHSRSTFDTARSTFAEMPRLFFVAVLAFSTFAILSGCASTTTTTVGITTNEAPRFHEAAR
jgi:hypothetical protein